MKVYYLKQGYSFYNGLKSFNQYYLNLNLCVRPLSHPGWIICKNSCNIGHQISCRYFHPILQLYCVFLFNNWYPFAKFIGEKQISLNGTIVRNETSTSKIIFADGLNTICIGYWWEYYTQSSMASIELYLKPLTSNDIELAMNKNWNFGLYEENCNKTWSSTFCCIKVPF